MEPFATPYDYIARYGQSDACKDLTVLLADATAFIASQTGFELRPGDDVQAANLVRVTCSVVHRFLSEGGLAGIQSYSEGANGFTASVTPYNPSGGFRLSRDERRSLKLLRGRVGATDPFGCGGADG